jgi:hypothetical protein
MVKDGKGYNVGVECLGILEVATPCVIYNSLNEDLDATLSSPISILVLNQGGPGDFGANAGDVKSIRIDCRVIAGWTGGWAYKGSAVVVKTPIRAGNKSPEVVDAVDAVVGGLKKDRKDGVGETDKIVAGGLSINGEEERLGCCKG